MLVFGSSLLGTSVDGWGLLPQKGSPSEWEAGIGNISWPFLHGKLISLQAIFVQPKPIQCNTLVNCIENRLAKWPPFLIFGFVWDN
jgi:hypothetical protein